jgi:hypothetical protein
MLIAAVTGQIPSGVTSVERALPGVAVVDEVRRRGFNLATEVSSTTAAGTPRSSRP